MATPLTKSVVVTWINNGNPSKAGKRNWYFKHGDQGSPPDSWEIVWAKEGQINGMSKGDHIEYVATLGKTGGENLVTWKKKTNGAGQEIKTYRQNEAPGVID